MRLTELNPRWVENDGVKFGVEFDCPAHPNSMKCDNFKDLCYVPFSNPINGVIQKNGWIRTGENFESLTLHPSVNYIGHWHGWIQNGEVTGA